MRQYKAIPIDGKDFVYGWHIELEDEHYIIPDTASICYGVNIRTSYYNFIEGFVEVIPETVKQQIGRKDKNDEDIYDGDSVDFRLYRCGGRDTGSIRWQQEKHRYAFYFDSGKEGPWGFTDKDEIEII